MTTMPPYTSTTNACKLCRPLGASLAFRGIEGTVPFLHGSQGCATYMRRYIISHFNEPIDIASSSLGEKHAVYGGAANLKLGLRNVTRKYAPQLIGVATTCLTETIGDDVKMIISEYEGEFHTGEGHPRIVSVSTPSYGGTHMEGFNAALQAVAEQLTEPTAPHAGVNVLPGFVSAADLRYLKEMLGDFGLSFTLFPDYAESLDGQALNDYPLIPAGGTPLAAIRAMGGLTAELAALSGRPVPERYSAARGRLIDAMVDGHKYLSGKRAIVYGEEDLVVGLTSFLAEIGIKSVLCASGGKSGRFREAIAAVLAGLPVALPEVREDVDFHDIEDLADNLAVDLLVGHSKGYTFARKKGIPLVRVGFPIHDRMGGQRLLHLGYHGAQALFDSVVNTLIAKKQDDSEVGYTYM